MRVSILIRKSLVEEDWDVSDGESYRGEFDASIRVAPLSRREILVELVGEEDKTIVSLIMNFNELKKLFNLGVEEFIKQGGGCD